MRYLEKSIFAKRISPTDGEYFFGYYDLAAFNGKLHLAHKASFADRLQMPGDAVQFGVIDIENGKFETLGQTRAWNFQQGAMLQWNPAAPKREIIYNCLLDGTYAAAVMDIETGKTRYLDRPVANVSPKGDYALSINFSRLYTFRPGYGYADIPDPFFYKNHSAEDGVFLINMQTGKSKLIISLEQIWEFTHDAFGDADQKIIINHITFNTEGTRFLMLSRNFHPADTTHKTAIITADTDGGNLFLLSDYGVQSHYNWYDEDEVIFFSDGKELACTRGWANTYVLRDRTQEGRIVADGWFVRDNHMSYSPDRRYLVTDTYTDLLNMQPLRVYDIAADICMELGKFYALPRCVEDIRCDLHPRWNENGSLISFDSTHEGRRGIYLVNFEDVTDAMMKAEI